MPAGRAANACTIDLVEALEEPRLGGLRDTGPVIRDRGDDPIGVASNGDRDVTPVRAELDGVVDQVHEHLAEALAVPADRRDVIAGIDDEVDALPLGEQSKSLCRMCREPAEVDVVHEDEPATAFDTAQFEQLIDHLDEVAGLDLDLADPVAHPRRDRLTGGCGVAAERLGEKAHGRQRRPQLVRQVVDELGTDLLEATKLGYVLEDDPDAAIRAPDERGRRR